MEKYNIKGISCASCSQKIEDYLNKQSTISEATLNFSTGKLIIETELSKEELNQLIAKVESSAKIISGSSNHDHGHDHEHDSNVKFLILRIIITSIILVLNFFIAVNDVILFLTYFLIGYDVIFKAVKNILRGNLFDEFFLMSLATIAALSINEMFEAIAVMLFYNIGELLQSYSIEKSRNSIKSLLELNVKDVNVVIGEQIVSKKIEAAKIDDIILVKSGEKIPLDGVVIEGSAQIDTSSFTGESVPKKYTIGAKIYAGMLNIDSTLKIKVEKRSSESEIVKILDIVESATNKKTTTERFITKFSKLYTPIVVILAVALVIVLPFFLGISLEEALNRAIILLIISCPCALVLSVPLSYFSGIGALSKHGILVKGGKYIDEMAAMNTLLVDKTGTLTKGNFEVDEIKTYNDFTVTDVIKYAKVGEENSTHPIAQAILKLETEVDFKNKEEFKVLAGLGLEYQTLNGERILIGNQKLMEENQISVTTVASIATKVYIACNNQLAGLIIIKDQIKETTPKAIARLHKNKIERIVMLTGDNQEIAADVASAINIDNYYAELLPEDKLNHLKAYKKANKVGVIGDGINDALMLATADVSFAMGYLGSDIAIESADVIINDDDLLNIDRAITLSRFTRKITIQNIVFALVIKILFVSLGIFGEATMIEAVFSDVGVTLIVILNSLRILKRGQNVR